MSFDSLVLATLLFFLLFALYKELFHPAAAFMIVITLLVLFGILEPKEALQGFSNPQVAVIVLLLVVTSVLKKFKTTALLFKKIVSENLSYEKFILRLMVFTSFLSSFLNNTPVVATLIPYVYNWGRKKKISPSKLLIPLSYAAILGGTATLIGTSTNLVVNALYIEAGYPSLRMIDFALVGVPAILLGITYMYFIGGRILPERKDALKSFYEKKREYIIETVVPHNSPVAGKTVQEARLRNLKGLFLAEIVRGKERILPVSPEDIIEKGDVLIFVGETEKIVELVKGEWGLKLPRACSIDTGKALEIIEAVVSHNSSLSGKKVKDTDFRAKYDAVILAVHRNGEKLSGKVGEIILKPGDLLLILAGRDFWKRVSDSDDIYVMTKVTELDKENERYGIVVLFLFVLTVILASFGVISLFNGLLLLLSLLIVLKVTTYGEIRKNIDLNLAIIAALSIALGHAMVKTGLADFLASNLINLVEPLGVTFALLMVYLITNLLTEFVTNIAAASISFPIALSVAEHFSVNPKAFVLAVAFAASASFLTPIGYQTNLMVYSAGNYRFSDFVRVGFPLALSYMFLTILLLKIFFL
ncbi:MAG: SLC13 family permease [Desulfurobacteriaceae bacterium]